MRPTAQNHNPPKQKTKMSIRKILYAKSFIQIRQKDSMTAMALSEKHHKTICCDKFAKTNTAKNLRAFHKHTTDESVQSISDKICEQKTPNHQAKLIRQRYARLNKTPD
jgi:hypothetical protein